LVTEERWFLSDNVYNIYPSSLINDQQWFQGYRDGAICTHKTQHTAQYQAGFNAGCRDRKAGLIHYGDNGTPSSIDEVRYPPLRFLMTRIGLKATMMQHRIQASVHHRSGFLSDSF
jgi:hypothetical protein